MTPVDGGTLDFLSDATGLALLAFFVLLLMGVLVRLVFTAQTKLGKESERLNKELNSQAERLNAEADREKAQYTEDLAALRRQLAEEREYSAAVWKQLTAERAGEGRHRGNE